MPVDTEFPRALYRIVGYRIVGQRAVRVDILERLADLIRPLIAWRRRPTAPTPPEGAVDGNGFTVTVAMTSLLGCSGDDFASVLRGLGYRFERRPVAPRKPRPPTRRPAVAEQQAEMAGPPETAEPAAGEAVATAEQPGVVPDCVRRRCRPGRTGIVARCSPRHVEPDGARRPSRMPRPTPRPRPRRPNRPSSRSGALAASSAAVLLAKRRGRAAEGEGPSADRPHEAGRDRSRGKPEAGARNTAARPVGRTIAATRPRRALPRRREPSAGRSRSIRTRPSPRSPR